MKKISTVLGVMTLLTSLSVLAIFGLGEDKQEPNSQATPQEKTDKDCEIPAFAKAIGHEDMWLLHNGCPPREKEKSETEKAN